MAGHDFYKSFFWQAGCSCSCTFRTALLLLMLLMVMCNAFAWLALVLGYCEGRNERILLFSAHRCLQCLLSVPKYNIECHPTKPTLINGCFRTVLLRTSSTYTQMVYTLHVMLPYTRINRYPEVLPSISGGQSDVMLPHRTIDACSRRVRIFLCLFRAAIHHDCQRSEPSASVAKSRSREREKETTDTCWDTRHGIAYA